MDRNCDLEPIKNAEAVSLSARRAWIEMVCFNVIDHSAHRRSPQGERG